MHALVANYVLHMYWLERGDAIQYGFCAVQDRVDAEQR
jgi:hypothetical protein